MNGEYIGDGVYVEHDGYNVWVRVERDGRVHEVALEPEVLKELADWTRKLYAKHGLKSPVDGGGLL